jgi:hypothetical protein
MTQDKTHSRSQSPEQSESATDPAETFKSQDGKALPKKSMDFSKLDLRVEKVDERISPSETNVFDK